MSNSPELDDTAPRTEATMMSISPDVDLDDTDHHANLQGEQHTQQPAQPLTLASAAPESTSNSTSSLSSTASSSCTPPALFQPIVSQWRKGTQWIHYGISTMVLGLSLRAARAPKATLALVLGISFALLITGYFTGFTIDVSEEEIFAPLGVMSREHKQYINELPGFPPPRRAIMLLVHSDGDNVVTYEAMNHMFRAVDTVRQLPEFETVCPPDEYQEDSVNAFICRANGPTRWWYDNSTYFQQATQGSDAVVQAFVSNSTFPSRIDGDSGPPAFQEFLLGSLERSPDGTIDYAQCILTGIVLPAVGDKAEITMEVEAEIIRALLELRDEFGLENPRGPQLEFLTLRSLPDELIVTMTRDIPLVPFVFLIMCAFTCAIFWRKDRVQSRCVLGFGSIVTIGMSIMSGYGLAFIFGVPFTNMTMILPFVVFGVGLDDTFIITGAYFRTDHTKDTVERIRETMEEVGASISLTTITTTVAFILGSTSTIPGIRWLCIYAFPTIFIDFIYQITFFVAILVLDERRIQANRKDCCCWTVVSEEEDVNDVENKAEVTCTGDDGRKEKADPNRHRSKTEDESASSSECTNSFHTHDGSKVPNEDEQGRPANQPHEPWPDRVMEWYAERLLQPVVKVAVIIGFAIFVAVCAYHATMLKQEFKVSDFLSAESYPMAMLTSLELYNPTQTFRLPTYFRFVDQGDPEVQAQMLKYIDDIAALPQFGKEPEYCWVRDFQKLKNGTFGAYEEYAWVFNSNMTFNEQIKFILSVPEVAEVYGQDIALDADGNIEASKCWFSLADLDINVVKEQVDLMEAVKRVTAAQPVNQGRWGEDSPFFVFDAIFFLWEFYTVCVDELTFTTISGVIAITVIGFILIPHWTAVLFVTPLIMVLYVDLLGTIQFSGLAINPLTYVCLVISIGLLVDFLMHVILRYYESAETTREAKVKDTLKTMGSSILVGGLSTCLGVVPLAFANGEILKTVFVSFIAMVTLGLGHGLILLPVLLSYWGPTVCVRLHHQDLVEKLHIDTESPQELASHDEQNTPVGNSTVESLETGSTKSKPSFDSISEEPPCSANVLPDEVQNAPVPPIGQIDSESTIDVDNPPSSFDSTEQQSTSTIDVDNPPSSFDSSEQPAGQPAGTPLEQNIPQIGQMKSGSSIDVDNPPSSFDIPEQPAEQPTDSPQEQNTPQIGQMDSSESTIDVDNPPPSFDIPEQPTEQPADSPQDQNTPQIGQMDPSESTIDVDNHIAEQTASSPHPLEQQIPQIGQIESIPSIDVDTLSEEIVTPEGSTSAPVPPASLDLVQPTSEESINV